MGPLTLWLACAPEPEPGQASTPLPGIELCTGGVDEDGDGAVDCDDPDCAGQCPEDCGNGRDDDGDARIDCNDADCTIPSCPENCDDGRDGDGDHLVDCDDPDCDGACPERCGDRRDNDGDGLTDCDDADCAPECPEVCGDGRDNDGDGLVDCNDPNCTTLCVEDCANGLDDDADGAVDCDDPSCDATCDADGDGYVSIDFGGDDCDDDSAAIHPGAPEQCGNGDDDCNGLADDNDPDVDPATWSLWYLDRDGDGYGRKEPTRLSCAPGPNLVADNTDCADHDAATHPGAQEVCGEPGWDEDCDHLVDEADPSVDLSTLPTWYVDGDADGFGDPAQPILACAQPEGAVDNALDCYDDDPSAGWPLTWYGDADGDGFGGPAVGDGCTGPDGAVRTGGDCDDGDATLHPEAPERCDGADDDCDDMIDWSDDDHVCVIDPTSELADVTPIDPAEAPWGYGGSVSAEGGLALVAGDDGRAWIWQIAPTPTLIGLLDDVGSEVPITAAVGSDWLALGAPDVGEVLVYARDGLGLVAAFSGPADLGASVASFGDRVASGAPSDGGGLRIWARVDDDWALDVEISGADGSGLGDRVALGEGRWVATAPGLDEVWVGETDGSIAALPVVAPTSVALDADLLAVGRADGDAVELWRLVDGAWTRLHELVPHEPAEGLGASVALQGGLLVAGAPGGTGTAVVWAEDGGTWREAAWITSSGGAVRDVMRLGPAPDATFDVVCAPFGVGDGWGNFQGLVYSGVSPFHLNPGDRIAFDLVVENDADIVGHIALGAALVDGGDEPETLVEVVHGGRPAAIRGNNVAGDFELAFNVAAPFDFAGGGLVLRFEPSGSFRSDTSCTEGLAVTGADDPSGQLVERFYYEYDGNWPWTKSSTSEVAPVELRFTSRPAFGSAVAVDGGAVLIGAPGAPPPPVEAEGDVPVATPVGSATVVIPLDPALPW